jgi:hypothetical protein
MRPRPLIAATACFVPVWICHREVIFPEPRRDISKVFYNPGSIYQQQDKISLDEVERITI